MIDMKIETNFNVSKLKLLRLGKDLNEGIRIQLAKIALGAKKYIKNNMGGYLGEGTGWLKKHVYSVKRAPTRYVVAAPRHIAEALEKGTTINAKKGKYLNFKTKDGAWHKVKSVTIAPRKWFARSFENYEGSTEHGVALNKALDSAIKKFGDAAVTQVLSGEA
jgi:hypothetical protein